jgi:hypothetical protein
VRMSADNWKTAVRDGMRSGSWLSVMSTVILVACGKRERGDAARAINGPSQWVWGRYAPHVRGASLKHTLVGYLIHHAMSVFWGVVYERVRPKSDSRLATITAAGAVAAAAYIADFKIVPKRFSPGFETELSRGCLIAAYVSIAAALAYAALTSDSRRRGPPQ